MKPTRIHHLNFVVRDLDAACSHFQTTYDLDPFVVVEHAPRGANIAYAAIGDAWIVLVCPYDVDSAPGQFLEQHGEGFFLLSLATADLNRDLERIMEQGSEAEVRDGILDWRVADLGVFANVVLQVTQDR